MEALLLDYQLTRRAPKRGEVIALILALALTVVVGTYYQLVGIEMSDLEDQQAALRPAGKKSASDRRLAGMDPQQLRTEIKQANEVMSQLGLPWETLFRDIESAAQHRVALLAIEPDSNKHTVRITGEARDMNAMLAYIQFLQEKSSLRNVYLHSHQIEQAVAEKPVRFTIGATWVIKQ